MKLQEVSIVRIIRNNVYDVLSAKNYQYCFRNPQIKAVKT